MNTFASVRTARAAALLGVLSAALIWRSASAQPPDDASIEDLRRKLDEKARIRAAGESLQRALIVPWEENLRSDLMERDSHSAVVVLVSKTTRVGAVWSFRSLDARSRHVVRACVDPGATQWVRLSAGDWEATLRVGIAGRFEESSPPLKVRLRADLAYRSEIDGKTETQIERVHTRSNKKAKERSNPVESPSR